MYTQQKTVGPAVTASGKSVIQLQPNPFCSTGDDRPVLTDAAVLAEQRHIRTNGTLIPCRPFLSRDIYQGREFSDPEQIQEDIDLLRKSWPTAMSPHLSAMDCAAAWECTDRRALSTLLRLRQRNWVEMWRCRYSHSFHLMPAGAAVLMKAAKRTVTPPLEAFVPAQEPEDDDWDEEYPVGVPVVSVGGLFARLMGKHLVAGECHEIEEVLRSQSRLLKPKDRLKACRIVGRTAFCTVRGPTVCAANRFVLFLKVYLVTLDSTGEPFGHKIIDIPVPGPDCNTADRLGDRVQRDIINPAVDRLAWIQQCDLDATLSVIYDLDDCHVRNLPALREAAAGR